MILIHLRRLLLLSAVVAVAVGSPSTKLMTKVTVVEVLTPTSIIVEDQHGVRFVSLKGYTVNGDNSEPVLGFLRGTFLNKEAYVLSGQLVTLEMDDVAQLMAEKGWVSVVATSQSAPESPEDEDEFFDDEFHDQDGTGLMGMFFVSAMALFLALWIRGDNNRRASDVMVFQKYQRETPMSKFAAGGLLTSIGAALALWIGCVTVVGYILIVPR